MALVITAPTTVRAGSRNSTLPSYQANPGSILEVPLSLDNAEGLAAIRVQINFDPGVLELQTVTTGPLGEAFELSQGNGDGFVQLVFVRTQELAGGSGRLAVLRFRANAGAVTDLYSELAIADFNLSDSTGVIDLRQKDTLSTTNGHVAVTIQPNIDNAGSGLPDWWEQEHGLDLFTANANLDPDHDGVPNIAEFLFGMNPTASGQTDRLPVVGRAAVSGQNYLTICYRRLKGIQPARAVVQESTDLITWSTVDQATCQMGAAEDMGNGTERITVRATSPVSTAGVRFMRVAVEPQ